MKLALKALVTGSLIVVAIACGRGTSPQAQTGDTGATTQGRDLANKPKATPTAKNTAAPKVTPKSISVPVESSIETCGYGSGEPIPVKVASNKATSDDEGTLHYSSSYSDYGSSYSDYGSGSEYDCVETSSNEVSVQK